MGLDDFERDLVAEISRRSHADNLLRAGDDAGERKRTDHRHHHHNRSHSHREQPHDGERHRRHKRDRERDHDEGGKRRKRHRSRSPRSTQEDKPRARGAVEVFTTDSREDEWTEKEGGGVPASIEVLDRPPGGQVVNPQRDSWMQEPSALDVEYAYNRKPKAPSSQFVSVTHDDRFQVDKSHSNQLLANLQRGFDDENYDKSEGSAVVNDTPAQHDVSYKFGDSGSSWRMTKLRAVYRQAKESGQGVDDVALERYGDLRGFDEAREEERELERRKTYGREYVGLEKPSGELFQDRRMKDDIRRQQSSGNDEPGTDDALTQGTILPEVEPPRKTAVLDATALNKLKAQMMKAKIRNAPNAAELEATYNLAEQASLANVAQPDVVILSNMDNRQLAGGRQGEVNAINTKRGRERGLVEDNENMSIADMVRHEKRTRGVTGGEGKAFAECIVKDGKYKDDLDYMDENAEKLSKKIVKSDLNLRNAAIGDFQKMQAILEGCPLCYHEEANQPPVAPVVSLATRTYLTLTTEPEIAKGGVVIVPIQHHLNLLECDDDEWEEIRNFMKSLTRYYDTQDKSVIFYENAAHMMTRKGHAALVAIPLPHHLADTAPAYFKEAILSSSSEWSQHKPIIDTLALTHRAGYGKNAFRKSMVKEMPYFHVFFTLDGGMGHVIEDERKWRRGDLFARETVGGMLDRGPEIIKKQGRWERHDRRIESFKKKWDKWDWTKALMDAQ